MLIVSCYFTFVFRINDSIQQAMMHYRLFLTIPLLYCVIKLTQALLYATSLELPDSVSLDLAILAESLLLGVLYSLIPVLKEFTEKRRILVWGYVYLIYEALLFTFNMLKDPDGDLAFLLPVSVTLGAIRWVFTIALCYQFFTVKSQPIRPYFQFIGATLLLDLALPSSLPLILPLLSVKVSGERMLQLMAYARLLILVPVMTTFFLYRKVSSMQHSSQ